MNALPVEFKGKVSMARNLAFFFLIAMALTACTSYAPAAPTTEPTPGSATPPQSGGQPPIILRVIDRGETVDGFLYVYQNIYFTDPDGDAVAVTYQEVSSSLSYPIPLPDEAILASAEEQKREVLATVGGKCGQKMELVFECRIRDRAGNLSEPVTFRISCITPPVVDTESMLVSGLSIALPIALLLLLGFWLLFRKSPGERLPALRSMLLLFFLLLWLKFIALILHEGGHTLYTILHRITFTLYVHPFTFSGYSRPVIDASIWKDILGSLTAIPLALLISLPVWKSRSPKLLPLIMLFPFVATFQDGINVTGLLGGDFRNLVQINGLSPIPFLILGVLIFLIGVVLLLAIFPLLGLDPKDKKSLFVLPAAMFLWNVLSFLIAICFVPGSPIDREYFLGREIVGTANMSFITPVVGLLLAVVYITLFRKIFPRLPAWLRTNTVQVTWKDLRIPAILATVSVILGLIIIT